MDYFLDWFINYLSLPNRNIQLEAYCVKYICDLINSTRTSFEKKILLRLKQEHL